MESHHDTITTIGRSLRYRRWFKKLSISDLAKASGVCQRSIIYYEQGLSKPTLTNLLKLCRALELKLTLTPNEDIDRLEY